MSTRKAKGRYLMPGEKARVLVNGQPTDRIVEVAELLVRWMGLAYRMTNGDIYLEWNVERI